MIVKADVENLNDDSFIEYGLESIALNANNSQRSLPFRINNSTGEVFVNETLKDRAGENYMLYVTAYDGNLLSKMEVWAKVYNGTNRGRSRGSGSAKRITAQIPLRNFNGQLPHLYSGSQIPIYQNVPNYRIPTMDESHVNVKKSSFQQEPPVSPQSRLETTVSSNVTSSNDVNQTDTIKNEQTQIPEASTSNPIKGRLPLTTSIPASLPSLTGSSQHSENNLTILASPAEIRNTDFTTVIITVTIIFSIFFAGAIVLIVFQRKFCLGSVGHTSKDEIQKVPAAGIQLNEDPSLTMQQWHGPRAFNNRYEPWERETTQNSSAEESTVAKPDPWEYPRHRLKIFNILGEGAFGQVWRCEATDIGGKEGITIVAVKTLKENATEKERSDLASELEIMKTLEPHPNVVRLMGCCTENGPLLVIMEYISRGKLQSYLRNSRAERFYGNMHGQSKSLTSRDLTSFVYQVARGMEYVSSKGIIHRDLAARNVLITEDHTCKVADFGFARNVRETNVYERKSEGGLPIRWMAPESLYDNIFSIKSDVWSFGVFIWEVVTLGSTPYPGLSAAEVMRKVRDGYRLDKPEHCRRELYNIMYYCWNKDPNERPTFAECVALIEKLLLSETDYIELERFPDHSYYNMLSLSGEKL